MTQHTNTASGAADRAIEGCPELNMGNYDEVEVERLNDWAIRAHDEIDRLHALAAGQATAAQAVVLDDVAALVRAAQAFVLEPDSHKKKLELEAMAWGPLAAATQPAPVLWLSPEQFANFVDADEAPFGKYVPARKTSAGKFTMPLFAARAPAPAQPVAQQGVAYAALPAWWTRFIQNVCEIPDRNSPEGEPDAIVATPEELAECALAAIESDGASHGQAPASVLHLVHSAFAEIAMAFPKAFALHKVGIADTAVREALAAPAPPPECETEAEKRAFAFGWFKALESERMKAESVQEDAARYRWLAASCRSTSEHWGGRWSIIIDGPAPKSHDSEDDFDAAVDAARKQGEKP